MEVKINMKEYSLYEFARDEREVSQTRLSGKLAGCLVSSRSLLSFSLLTESISYKGQFEPQSKTPTTHLIKFAAPLEQMPVTCS